MPLSGSAVKKLPPPQPPTLAKAAMALPKCYCSCATDICANNDMADLEDQLQAADQCFRLTVHDWDGSNVG